MFFYAYFIRNISIQTLITLLMILITVLQNQLFIDFLMEATILFHYIYINSAFLVKDKFNLPSPSLYGSSALSAYWPHFRWSSIYPGY